MDKQLSYLPDEEPPVDTPTFVVDMRTYIYRRPDGTTVHCQAAMGIIGEEYEHDDPNWQPGDDWPYKVIDLRK